MQDINRSLRRSSASSSHQTFLNLEYKQKVQLKRVIDFLQEQYEGLASQLASKQLELKVAKSRRMPSESFQLRNQEYQTKSEINQLKFKHMTELQETMAQHQLEIDIIKNQFEEKLQRQYQNFKREFNRNKKQNSGKLQEEMMELSEKNIQLTRNISQLEIKLKQQERKTMTPQNQQELKNLRHLVTEKEIEIQRLERQLKESEQYISQMKHKLIEKNKEIDYFVSQMNREKSTSRFSMYEKPTQATTKIQKKMQKSQILNSDVNDLSDQLVFIKEENDRIRKLNQKYKSLVTDKQTQIQGLNNKLASIQKEIGSQSIQVQGLNQQIKQYQTGKKIFESEMIRLNDNIQKGLGDVNSKQNQIRGLLQTIDKLKAEYNILNGRIADQDLEKKRLQEIISRQNTRLGQLQEQIRQFNIKSIKKDQQTIELNGRLQIGKTQYKGLQIAFKTKQNEYQIVCNQNREYLLNNQSLKNELNESKRQADELRHKLHKTQDDNNDLLQSLKELKVQYQNVRIENSTLKQFEEACSHLRHQIVQLEHQLKLLKEDNRKEIQETYRYKLQYQSALVQLQETEARLKEIEAERMDFSDRAQLLEQLKKYTQVVETTSKLNSQLSHQMRSLKEGNSRLAEEKIGLEKKLERVQQKTLKSRTIDNSKVSSIGPLQSQITRLQLLVGNLQNQKKFYETKAEDATREKQKLMSTLQRQLADINYTSRQKQDQSRNQLQNLYRTVNDAKQQIHNLKGQLNNLSMQNSKLKNNYKGEQQLQALEIQGLREELKRKINQNQTISKKWNNLKEEQMQKMSTDKHLNIMLQSQLSATKTKLQLTQVNLKDRQGDIDRLNSKFQKVISEKESIQVQLDRLKIDQWKFRTGVENLQRQKQSLTKQLKSKQLLFQQELNTLKSDNQQLSASNQELTEYIKDLQKQRNRLQMDNQMINEGFSRVTKQRNEFKQVNSKIELDLASTRVQNQSLKRKKPQLQSPKASFNQINKLKQELDKERRSKKQLQDQIQTMKTKGKGDNTKKEKEKQKQKQRQHKRKDTQDQQSFTFHKNSDHQMEIKRLNEQLRIQGVQFNELLKYRSDLEMKLIQTGDELRMLRQQLSNRANMPSSISQKQNENYKSTQYIRQLQTRCRLVQDINNQLRKKQYQQQQKVTRILADNKSELTHYKLQNNRLQKQKTELQMRYKQLNNKLSDIQNQKSFNFKSNSQQINHLRQQLKNVYGQIHSLNNILIQKQSQISSLMKSKEPTVFGSLQYISSPKDKDKQKRTLKNTEDCWKEMQDRIKAGQRQYNKNRMYN